MTAAQAADGRDGTPCRPPNDQLDSASKKRGDRRREAPSLSITPRDFAIGFRAIRLMASFSTDAVTFIKERRRATTPLPSSRCEAVQRRSGDFQVAVPSRSTISRVTMLMAAEQPAYAKGVQAHSPRLPSAATLVGVTNPSTPKAVAEWRSPRENAKTRWLAVTPLG